MVDAVADLLSVHPHKLLSVVEPFHLELFLADRAEAVGRVVWDGQVLDLWLAGCGWSGSWCTGTVYGTGVLVLFNFAGFNPVLRRKLELEEKSGLQRHIPFHPHTNCGVGRAFPPRSFFGEPGNASPYEPSFSFCPRHLLETSAHIACTVLRDARTGLR